MIELSDVHYRYPRATVDALCGITLHIQESGFVAIMGSNGSGKSTLARCLNGLIFPDSGVVTVDGLRTSDEGSLREVRRRVGMVFQDPNLQMTAVTVERELAFGLENLGVDPGEMHTRVDKQLAEFGLARYRREQPSSLSGGEKQRLAIACVLLLEPRYLVLDEPTSLISAVSRRALMDLALKLQREKGMGVVLITQFPQEALLADRLLVLEGGRVAYDDSPRHVFQHVEELTSLGVSVPVRVRLQQLL
jgi:energy-coupling factor transport system ATP-binding protein